jgi:hypothetical protein
MEHGRERVMRLNGAERVFDSADLSVLQEAYDEACRELGIDPHPADRSSHQYTRETLASAIVAMAANGLWDPRILKRRALLAVRKPAMSESAPLDQQPHP